VSRIVNELGTSCRVAIFKLKPLLFEAFPIDYPSFASVIIGQLGPAEH